jgi:multidrug efflux pump subunit AcrA (membrane-fusion protein)
MKDIADRTKAGDAAVDLAEEAVAQTEIDRFNLQIKEATLRSPLDGVVMSEDITNKIGAKEQQATVLFEVAPPGSLRADLEVNERDIAEIKGPGQKGYLATSTFPGRYFDFRIERIIPKATPKEGDNSFTVYATIDNPASWMRPGLTGEAKVNTDHRTILWIWTHRLVEFIRLKLWM